jgi:protein-S-isoprenylcysteine O-methyltransferase Ste14
VWIDKGLLMKKPWKPSGTVVIFTVLTVLQYVLGFFVFKLPGVEALHWVGWGIWVLSCVFGFVPIITLRQRGGVPKGKSYVHTTQLVDSGLYAIVRHPQYVAGILLNVALMFLAQQWLIIGMGIVSASLIYRDILPADQEGLEKFGDEYRSYMQRVPRANFVLGIFRLIKVKTKQGET